MFIKKNRRKKIPKKKSFEIKASDTKITEVWVENTKHKTLNIMEAEDQGGRPQIVGSEGEEKEEE